MTTPEESQGRAWAYRLLARLIEPPPRLNVAQWAEQRRIVSADSGTPHPGPWRHSRAPHLIEIMEVMSPTHPASEVIIRKSAQTGATEAAVNLLGYVIDVAPAPFIYTMPTLDAASRFNKQKIEPMIEAVPSIRQKIIKDRLGGRESSTSTFKCFSGGYAVIANAHASAQLQSYSARYLVCDEVTQYPGEAGDDGDPVTQLEARLTAWERRGYKKIKFSTPGIKGHCRIEAAWEVSDKRRLYLPAPCCGWHQPLDWKRLRWRQEEAPFGAYFECAHCGSDIEFAAFDTMVLADPLGEGLGKLWIKTYLDESDPGNPEPPEAIAPEEFARWRRRPSRGRSPGFAVWQAESRFATWDGIVRQYLDARENTQKLKAFTQRVRGEPWEEKGEAPDAEKLFLMRGDRPRGSIPSRYPVLTGAVDVQGNRLEWSVYAWGARMRSALVDWGVIEGPTNEWATWQMLDAVRETAYRNPTGNAFTADVWLLDAGYRSEMTYHYARTRGGSTGRPPLFPIRGNDSKSPSARVGPLLSQPRPVQYRWDGKTVEGGILRYDLNVFRLKSMLYDGLRALMAGPNEVGALREGSILLCRECDLAWCQQITAESLVTTTDRMGRTSLEWKKDGPNEQLDLWNYCRAGAEMIDLPSLTDEDWEAITAQREARAQEELFSPAARVREEARKGRPAGGFVGAGGGWRL